MRRPYALLALLGLLVPGAASAAPPPPHGPDVASFQHPHGAAVDWRQVARSGVRFAVVKATEGGDYVNPWFARDYAGAHDAGLVRSAYHFARPQADLQTARDQADALVRVAGTAGQQGDLPLALDLEVSGGLSPSQLVAWTRAFVAQVRARTHRDPLLYTYPAFWDSAMAGSTAFTSLPLWLASYRSGGPRTPLPGGWSSWTFWQYTDAARNPGIAVAVDQSRFAGDAAALTRLATPPTQPSPEPGDGPLPLPSLVPVPPLP